MKRKSGSLIVLVIAAIALFALNPTMADFKAYQKKKASDSVGGLFGKLAGDVNAAASGMLFDRANYGVASIFYTGKQSNMSNRYLGIAKMFIALDAKK